MIDGAFRLLYRLGFRAACVYWWLRRPHQRGAHVAVWLGERLLFVEQSYRPTIALPGGAARGGETALDAALRELAEEAGLALPADALTFVGDPEIRYEWRRNHETVFETRLAGAPAIVVDHREIVGACFLTIAEARRQALSPVAEWYMDIVTEAPAENGCPLPARTPLSRERERGESRATVDRIP
jgi:ADP-ribose pyrophosphatase YjhB (NUDIX family)